MDYSWDFFIAHAGPDMQIAETLYSVLASKANVFLDSRSLKPGDDWDREVPRAQRSSRITVVLISANTDKAYYEREEIAAAIAMARENEERHRVVPVYIGATAGAEIPYGLRSKHGLNAGGVADLTRITTQLLQLLQELQSGAAAAKKPEQQHPQPSRREYNTAEVRQMLTNALSDEDLGPFCMDYFPTVYEQFSTGMSKTAKIQKLIEYCSRHREFPRLFDLLRQINPAGLAPHDR